MGSVGDEAVHRMAKAGSELSPVLWERFGELLGVKLLLPAPSSSRPSAGMMSEPNRKFRFEPSRKFRF
jgi:hypothetical protein